MRSGSERPSAKILIVEDEAVVALDLQMQLEDMGYCVVGTAESGDHAIELARQHRPDLALMDVMLQGPMNGIAVADTLRRELRIPVLFLTSLNDDATVAAAAATSAYGYLTKPFQIRELRAGIEVAVTKARMEAELRDSERWFASTLRCVQDAVIITERDGTVRFVNPAAEALTGCRRETASGRPIQELLHFVDSPKPPAAVRALHDGVVVGVEHGRGLKVAGDGVVPVDESAAPVRGEDGEPLGAVQVLRDARDRLAQEEKLRASDERFRNTFDFAPLGMALVSVDGQFLLVNAALCRLLGVTADDLRGRREAEFSEEGSLDAERTQIQRLLAGEFPTVHFEKRYRHVGGESWWALVGVSLLHENDRPVCLLYHIHDLSDQKEAQQQLAELAAERVKLEAAAIAERAKDEFLSRVSHEMRTPLNAVIGFAQLLERGAAANAEQLKAYTRYITEAGQHLLTLVNDMLDIQRMAHGRLQLNIAAVNVADCVSAAVRLAKPHDADMTVTEAVPPGLTVLADTARLRQVLVNLVSNAIKYNRPGGSVTCSAARAAEGRVRIAVEDSGQGIPLADQGRLFQPFERLARDANTPGSGLGLYISRRLMHDMGGSMDLESEHGVGTRVTIELPEA